MTKLVENTELKVREKVVLVSPHEFDTISLHKVNSEHEAIATILKYLMNGQHVVYAPSKSVKGMNIVVSKAVTESLDFVAKNTSKSKERAKPEYYLELDK